jgi:hypothetical protein
MTLARFFHPKVIHAAPFGILRNENIDRTEINRASQRGSMDLTRLWAVLILLPHMMISKT